MSDNLTLDFAVPFEVREGTPQVSTAHLKQLIVATVATTNIPPPAIEIISDAGDNTTPLSFRISSNVGDASIFDYSITLTNPLVNIQGSATATGDMSAADFAALCADQITNSVVTAQAYGTVVEILPNLSGRQTDLTQAEFSTANAPASIPEGIYPVYSADDLANYTDYASEISEAFNGGISTVYVAIISDFNSIETVCSGFESTAATLLHCHNYVSETDMDHLSFWKGNAGIVAPLSSTLVDLATTENRFIYQYDDDTTANRHSNICYGLGAFLSAVAWGDKQYLTLPKTDGVVTELGRAEFLFARRACFALNDTQFGTRLGGLFAGGYSFSRFYIIEEFKLLFQSDTLNYIALNEPFNITPSHVSIENIGRKLISAYEANGYFDPNYDNSISVTRGLEAFTASAQIALSVSEALWRTKTVATAQ